MPSSLAGPWAEQIAAAIGESADPARALQEKRYLKSELAHLGTGIPALRRAVKAFLRAHPDLDRAELVALVDELAAVVAGGLVERFPGLSACLDRWSTDTDFWVRRSAILALLRPLRRGGGDWDRFAAYAEIMLSEREFFIRKAIGWVLRETAKQRPGLVYAWLEPRAGRASGVTIREGVKPLPPEQRERILSLARPGGRRSAAPRTGR
jgi:DNA alkylation repair enzyme